MWGLHQVPENGGPSRVAGTQGIGKCSTVASGYSNHDPDKISSPRSFQRGHLKI